MKTLYLLLSVITVLAIASSCKKSSNSPAPKSVVGYWVGDYGSGTATPSEGYAFLFRTNGTVRVYNNSDTTTALAAEGTYTLTDTVVTTNYTYITTSEMYSTTATLNSAGTEITGTWGSGANTSGDGTYYVVKQ